MSGGLQSQRMKMDSEAAREWFNGHFGLVCQVIEGIARRHRLEDDDFKSFRSYAYERLVDRDFRMIRAYSERAGPKTYLTVVLTNVYRDFRDRRHGKFRPSAAAVREGPAAILLDTLIHRHGQPREEAIRQVASRDDVDLTEAQLREIALRLPRRTRRSKVRLDDAPVPTSADDPDEDHERGLRVERMSEYRRALHEALEQLPDEDREILQLHVWEGKTLADVSRELRLKQKPLYRRVKAAYRRLRAHLEAKGFEGEDMADLLP